MVHRSWVFGTRLGRYIFINIRKYCCRSEVVWHLASGRQPQRAGRVFACTGRQQSPEGRQLRHSHYLVTHRWRGGLNHDYTHTHTLDLLYNASGSSRVLMRTSSIVTCCLALSAPALRPLKRTATFHPEPSHSRPTSILKTNDSH